MVGIHDTAEDIWLADKPVRLLWIGDYDPFGQVIAKSTGVDVATFATQMGGDVSVETIAVTPEQIIEHSPAVTTA